MEISEKLSNSRRNPVNHTYLPIVGTVLFTAGILVLFLLLYHLLRRLYSQRGFTRLRPRNRASMYRLMAVLLGLVFVLGAQLVFWVSGELYSYKIVRAGEALCSLDIYTPADGQPRLIYSTVDERGNELVEVFPVHGPQVRVAGEIIEWPAWIGLGKFFKMTAVEFVRTDSFGNTVTSSSAAIHQGSMPIFQRLSGWLSRLSIAQARTAQTSVFTADSTFSYNIFVKGNKLILE